jgi:tRNA-2-methylthio-N6-dimethylallyladenosine synthase
MIGVTGCVAQAEGEEILRRAPAVDLVFGPQTYHRLPDCAARAQGTARKVVDTDYAVEDKFEHLPVTEKEVRARGVTAFLTVQEGCDKFCTFCVVPYTRGSGSVAPGGADHRRGPPLADAGVREITLLGQNVNAWHGSARMAAEWGWATCSTAWPKSPASPACATPPAIRATWTDRTDRGASRSEAR